ncbi:MAG: AAA family ATPase, partial [Prevotella sp.]|nr:AAA family ATPase [Prevotella sp.]
MWRIERCIRQKPRKTGCGKTFFAEKMAEEIGINFMKIVPDDLACTWVHGTQQKIGEVFKNAE